MQTETQIAIGCAIRARRKELRMRQEKLAGALGISQPYLVRLEQGKTLISAARLQQIAQILRTDIATFYSEVIHNAQ
jgi:transcriptional regulator with XRE-family HTH domain